MADWQMLAQKLALLKGNIDPRRAALIENAIIDDGKIDKKEMQFLIAIRRETTAFPATLDQLLFKAIKATVLQDNFISTEDTRWLMSILMAQGKMGTREKRFLAELQSASPRNCKEFDDWCYALGVNSSPRKKMWLGIAILVSVVLLGVGGIGTIVVRSFWLPPSIPDAHIKDILASQILKSTDANYEWGFRDNLVAFENLDNPDREAVANALEGLRNGIKMQRESIQLIRSKDRKHVMFKYVLLKGICYLDVTGSIDQNNNFVATKIVSKLERKESS